MPWQICRALYLGGTATELKKAAKAGNLGADEFKKLFPKWGATWCASENVAVVGEDVNELTSLESGIIEYLDEDADFIAFDTDFGT